MEWNNNVCDTRGRRRRMRARNRPAALFSLSLRDLRQHLRSLIEGSVIKWFVTKRKVTGTRAKAREDGHWRWSSGDWIENCFRCPRGCLQFLRCCCRPSLLRSGWVLLLYYDRILEHLFAPCAGLEKEAKLKRKLGLWIVVWRDLKEYLQLLHLCKCKVGFIYIYITLLLFKTFLRFERLTSSPCFVIILETKISSSINTINYPWLIHWAFIQTSVSFEKESRHNKQLIPSRSFPSPFEPSPYIPYFLLVTIIHF